MSNTPLSNQVAVIDTSINGHESLVAAARDQDMEILLLSGRGGGIAELARKLAGRDDIDALHMLSHGSEGRIYLGDGVLSSETLGDHTEALGLIRESLSEDGALLVSGCRVGAEGRGAATRGGDWNLNGELASSSGLTVSAVWAGSAVESYRGLLATDFIFSKADGGNPLGAVIDQPDSAIIGDFDSDGDLPVYDDDNYDSMSLYQNDSSGTFSPVSSSLNPFIGIAAAGLFFSSGNVYVVGFDNDGDADVWDVQGQTAGDRTTGYLEQLGTPTGDSTGASTSGSIVITFDESVQLGCDNIEIRHVADDTLISIATLSGGSFTGGDATVSLSTTNTTNDTMPIHAAFSSKTDLYVRIDPSALSDTADGAAALTLNDNPRTLNFTTGTASDAPNLDLDTGAAGNDHTITCGENADQGTASTDGVTVTGSVATSDSVGTVETVILTLDNPLGDDSEGLYVDTASLASALDFSSSANQITITRNSATNVEVAEAIEAVSHQNDYGDPTTTNRIITVHVTDNASATATDAATATINVNAKNDAPTIENGASPRIAVTGVSGSGTWQYSPNGSTWTDFGTVSDGASLLLLSSRQVRDVPDGVNSDNAIFQYPAWEQMTGTASANGSPSTADSSSRGGATAFSENQSGLLLEVSAVKDSPSLTLSGSQTVDSADNAQTVADFVSARDPGAANESGQIVTVDSVTNDDNSLFFMRSPTLTILARC